MGLSHEHVGPKILAKIKICILTRAELLFNLCYEIPCNTKFLVFSSRNEVFKRAMDWNFNLEFRPEKQPTLPNNAK